MKKENPYQLRKGLSTFGSIAKLLQNDLFIEFEIVFCDEVH
jgi:hypothetical protein